MSQRKVRISLTLSRDIVESVDQFAADASLSRSGAVDEWLRRAARAQAVSDLDTAIADYYDALSPAEEAEDREWARFSTRSFIARESRSVARSARRKRAPSTRR